MSSRDVPIHLLIGVMLALVLMCLGSTCLLACDPPERSVRLNNYNNWSFRSDSTSNRQALLATLAARDNICFTEMWDVASKDIKSLNPKAKVYRVYDLCCKSRWESDWADAGSVSKMQTPVPKKLIDKNDWWLRDGKGEIVKENDDTWFLDVGKPGFREAFLRSILSRMSGKGFDGVVFDYWWPEMISSWMTHRGLAPPAEYPTDDDWFRKAWQPFVDYVARGLHDAGYRVIGNCVGEYGTSNPRLVWQRSEVDGAIYEQWAVDWPDRDGRWLDGPRIESRIRAMSRDPLEVWTADYGLRETDPEFERKKLVSLAMYYVAIPSSQENRSYHYYRHKKVFWDDLWDFDIGAPTGSAVKRSDEFFWSREFSNGLVLLNYEGSKDVTYLLSHTYHDPTGKAVSGALNVPPHTGAILALDE